MLERHLAVQASSRSASDPALARAPARTAAPGTVAPRPWLTRVCSALLLPALVVPSIAIALSLALTTVSWAAEPVSKSRFRGVAIGGHDTVAYHDIERDPHADAIEGERSHLVEYKGAKWYFASAASAEKFAADPERYKPAYNGFCANALSIGNGLLRTDGETWEIFGDELFLFFASAGRARWLAAGDDWTDYRVKADAAWAELSH